MAAGNGLIRTFVIKPIIVVACSLAVVSMVTDRDKASELGQTGADVGGWSLGATFDLIPVFFDALSDGEPTSEAKAKN